MRMKSEMGNGRPDPVFLLVVQGAGLYGKERKSFVARANLLNRPLRTRTVGGVGGDG